MRIVLCGHTVRPSWARMEPPAAAVPPAEAFAPLLTESLNGFAVLDASGRYAFASASLCELLSLEKDALLGCAAARAGAAGDGAARCQPHCDCGCLLVLCCYDDC